MLTAIRLQNFRAFKSAELRFAPITILAGANGSGKSSILQAINGVLQTKNERGFPFDFALNGELTQLGAYRNVVHGHNAKNSFGVSVDFMSEGKKFSAGGVFKVSDESGHLFPRSVEAMIEDLGRLDLEWNQKSQQFKVLIDVDEEALSQDTAKWIPAMLEMARAGESTESVFNRVLKGGPDEREAIKNFVEYFWNRLREARDGVVSESENPAGALRDFSAVPLFSRIRARIVEELDKMRAATAYVGPVRAYPLRYYSLAKQRLIADPFGESLSQMLAFWKGQRSPRFQEVKQALVLLELATDVNADLELGEFLKVTVKPKGRAFPDSLADVGFGVSQVLPVLVSDAALEDGGTLLVNQPEIHLHPSSQALLANYFARRIGVRRYVIETHSEYLITRLRLLVAKGEISEDSVVIHYFGTGGDGAATVNEVTISKTGELIGMPRDFFATYASDAFQLAMTVMEAEDDASQ